MCGAESCKSCSDSHLQALSEGLVLSCVDRSILQ